MKNLIASQKAPKAVGPYSQAVKLDNLLFTSGQIPLDPKTSKLVEGDIKVQARRVFDNIKAILKEADCTMDDIIKTTCYLSDIEDFAAVNQVYDEYFNKAAYPARSAVEVSALPKGALLEIDAIAVKE